MGDRTCVDVIKAEIVHFCSGLKGMTLLLVMSSSSFFPKMVWEVTYKKRWYVFELEQLQIWSVDCSSVVPVLIYLLVTHVFCV